MSTLKLKNLAYNVYFSIFECEVSIVKDIPFLHDPVYI
jgi:hypothetical protein